MYLGMETEIPPGSYIVITITDTGAGMDQNTQSQIFEPFFTTKEKGHGTGLGLSTAYGIVKQSGGEITVYSEPGQGTCFKIYLPRVDKPLPTADSGPAPASAECGDETILVVEDENGVRGLIVEALRRCGYNVLEAPDGPTALARYAQNNRMIDLVLTDVMMPKMNGREFANKFLVGQPQAKILFMSGYTDDFIMERGVLTPGTLFIHKPFTQGELTRMISKILTEPHSQKKNS
jgi:two-component system cell cycle sensor histidine kinase/response regulator CckA